MENATFEIGCAVEYPICTLDTVRVQCTANPIHGKFQYSMIDSARSFKCFLDFFCMDICMDYYELIAYRYAFDFQRLA